MPVDLDLCYLSASDALCRFHDGSLSPVDLVAALIARGEAANPLVNAFTYSFPERALEQARAAEARYRGSGPKPRPLEGIPVAIKDSHDVAGEITTSGSRLYADHRPSKTQFHVQRILDAGAILFARTTMPEFGVACVTFSDLWGITRNPWNLALSPGGSGGGAGAALAAGMVTLANGADHGGSIRVPAATCGLAGFKPPHGRVPGEPPWNTNSWHSSGPMGRSVADLVLLENVISGQHPGDIRSIPGHRRVPTELAPIDGWRIAFSPDLGFVEVDPEIAENTRAAANALRNLGCDVEEIDLPWTEEVFRAALPHYIAWGNVDASEITDEQRELLTDYVRRGVEHFSGLTDLTLRDTTRVLGEMYEALMPVFRRCRALICPTLAMPSVPADLHPIDGLVEINGKRVDPALGWTLCYPFNMLGQLPSMSVPSGFAANGVPIGLQIVGRPYDDASVFRVAAAFERLQPAAFGPSARPQL